MTSLAVRLLIAVVAGLLLVLGFMDVTAGNMAGLVSIGLGAAGLLAVAFERARYRSEAAERALGERPASGGGEPRPPAHPFQRTDEAFLDPTTRRRMRVYVDPTTGERRYHAES